MDELRYTELITKRLAGELSDAENASLNEWLETSDENRRIYAKLEQAWKALEPANTFAVPDAKNEWTKLEDRLGLAETAPKATIRPLYSTARMRESSSQRFSGWVRLAMAATLVFTVVGLSSYLGFLNFDSTVQVATANAQTQEVSLPDGSVVYLNSASEIAYSQDFDGSERIVKLQGEAYFDVEKSERPFIVVTENARVRVLGTAFNVWARDAQTRVTVEEGRVALSDLDESEETRAVLTANHYGVKQGQAKPIDVLEVDADQLIGWRDERIYFNAAPLSEVIAELERIYNINIQYSAADFGNSTTTLNLKRRTIESTLEVLAAHLNASYRVHENAYILERR